MMDKQLFLQALSSVPLLSLFVAKPVAAREHDFSTDEGLRRAIESLFAAVDPVQSIVWREHHDYPHITFALGCHRESDLPEVRKRIFESIRNHAAKEQGHRMLIIGEQEKCTLCWRKFPVTQSEIFNPDFDLPEEKMDPSKARRVWWVSLRASWWQRTS